MKNLFYTTGMCIALSLVACSNNKAEYGESALADTVGVSESSVADLSETKAKLVKTADVDFEVKDVYKSNSNIYQNAKKFGGLVMDNDIQTSQIDSKTIPVSSDSVQLISSYQVEARMTVRVPADNLNDFVQSVAADATIIHTAKLNIEDRSINYLGSTLKQQSRQKILDKELKKDTLKTDDLLTLANEQDGVIEGKINNLRTDARVKYSTVSLHYIQNVLLRKEMLPNNDLSVYQLPAYKRFGDAMSSGLNLFLDILIGAVYMWPFILFGIGAYVAYLYIKKKLRIKTLIAVDVVSGNIK